VPPAPALASIRASHNGFKTQGDIGNVAENLETLIGKEVVLDTAGPLVYLGVLAAVEAHGFWLDRADVHNVEEGHATREQYIAESGRDGIRANRQRVFVLRATVASISALQDVIQD
jgi:hypothetical protein